MHKKDVDKDSKTIIRHVTYALMLQRMLWYYCGCISTILMTVIDMSMTLKLLLLMCSGALFAYASFRNELEDTRI